MDVLTEAEPIDLLVVEDDPELGALLQEYLGGQGYRVGLESDGRRALERIRSRPPALVVLDVMLPGEDGFGVCRQLRPDYRGRILMLTAREDAIDQVLGLELGADDYVRKPVEPRVLLARVRALLRREPLPIESASASVPPAASPPNLLRIGAVEIDPGAREARAHGAALDLTDPQYRLLELLMRQAGRVLSRQDLFNGLRGIDYDGQNRGIDLLISQLRAKLGDDPTHPRIIKTVRARGYLFARPAQAD